MRAARLRTGYRLMAGASLAILTCLVLVILHTVPSWGAKGHAHMSEQVMGSRSFKLFTGDSKLLFLPRSWLETYKLEVLNKMPKLQCSIPKPSNLTIGKLLQKCEGHQVRMQICASLVVFLLQFKVSAENLKQFGISAGRNNTMTRNSTMTRSRQGQTPEWRSESRATKAEIRELLSQVARDLEPWKDGISLEMVERLYCVPESVDTLRFQVVIDHWHFIQLTDTLGQFCEDLLTVLTTKILAMFHILSARDLSGILCKKLLAYYSKLYLTHDFGEQDLEKFWGSFRTLEQRASLRTSYVLYCSLLLEGPTSLEPIPHGNQGWEPCRNK